MPDETTILRFRHLLEKHTLTKKIFALVNKNLANQGLFAHTGTLVDAAIIAAPSSPKNKDGKRDEKMHQRQKGKQWYFGMKTHTGADADSGLVHTVVCTPANVHDVTQAGNLGEKRGKNRAPKLKALPRKLSLSANSESCGIVQMSHSSKTACAARAGFNPRAPGGRDCVFVTA